MDSSRGRVQVYMTKRVKTRSPVTKLYHITKKASFFALIGLATVGAWPVGAWPAEAVKYRSVSRFSFSSKLFALASDGANRRLTKTEREQIAGDRLAAYRYTYLAALAAAGRSAGSLPKLAILPETRATRIPLTAATRQLTKYIRSDEAPDAWQLRLYKTFGLAGYDAYVSIFGSAAPALQRVAYADAGMLLALRMIPKSQHWQAAEPPGLSAKVDHFIDVFTPWGTADFILVRMIELGPEASEILLARWRSIRGFTLVPTRPADADPRSERSAWMQPWYPGKTGKDRQIRQKMVIATLLTNLMVARGDNRLWDTLRRDEIPEELEHTVRWRYDRHPPYATGRINIVWTRAFQHLRWTGDLDDIAHTW